MIKEDIYQELWERARAFYEKGRVYDIPHIEWMMGQVEMVTREEGLDRELLMPLAILHDVGYSMVDEKNPDIKSVDAKKLHMAEGAKIGERLMRELDFPEELVRRVSHYISVHDNWLLGDDSPYRENREMAVFNDLDFLWTTADYGVFKLMAQSRGMSPREFYGVWLEDEKLVRRPFGCEYTKRLWESSTESIREQLREDKS